MNGILIGKIVIALIIMHMYLGLISYLILLERKTAAWIQDRVGPNRVGPGGLLQPIVDGVKFILKEEFIPAQADKILFVLAPIAILTPAFVGFAIVPGAVNWLRALRSSGSGSSRRIFQSWSRTPMLACWWHWPVPASRPMGWCWADGPRARKYSFLGGLRATAQMLSYEVPLARFH